MHNLPKTISELILPMHHDTVARELEAIKDAAYHRGRADLLQAFFEFAETKTTHASDPEQGQDDSRDSRLAQQFRSQFPGGERICRDWIRSIGLGREADISDYHNLKVRLGMDPNGRTRLLPGMLRILGCVEFGHGKSWVLPLLLSE